MVKSTLFCADSCTVCCGRDSASSLIERTLEKPSGHPGISSTNVAVFLQYGVMLLTLFTSDVLTRVLVMSIVAPSYISSFPMSPC